jgi:hypothetical protein
MHPVVAFLLNALALYAAVGVVNALAFVAFGVTRVHPDPARRGGAVALCAGALAQGRHPMTRGHRTFHRMLWPVLAVLVALGFTLALALRPPPEPPTAPADSASKTRVNALMPEPRK